MKIKDMFLLNKDFYFFNHGSYGACPDYVFQKYMDKARLLESQPIDYFQKLLLPELANSRARIAEFIGAESDDIILTKNATYAANMVIRSLELRPQDEIIITNLEYGACINAWKFWQQEKGFQIRIVDFTLPLPDTDKIIERFEAQITSNTKAIYFSHITSTTAQLLPAAELCSLAEKHNILSILDGAHGVGQLSLNLEKMKCDFYFSNLHKWLYAPKGTAILYTKPDKQNLLKPLITGWGWGETRELLTGKDYVDFNLFYGTDDFSSFMVVGHCLDFYAAQKVSELKIECNKLVKYFLSEIQEFTKLDSLYKSHSDEMMLGVAELPSNTDLAKLKIDLYDKYKIEVPVNEWNGKKMIRISVQIYNNKGQVDYFIAALKELLSETR